MKAERPSTYTKPGLMIKVAAEAVLAAKVTPTTKGDKSPLPMAKLLKSPVFLWPR